MKTSSKIILNQTSEHNDSAQIITLENGARVIFDNLPHLKSATIGIWVNIGTRHEAAHENGIAHLMEHMVFKGAGSRNAFEIAEDTEARGVYLNASTSYERTGFYSRCLGDEAGFAFDMCADLVLNPHLRAEDLELEKNVVIHEINEAYDDAEDRAGVLNQMAAFSNQPLGRPILGDENSVKSIRHDQIVEFHNHYINPANMIIAFGGAFDKSAMLDKVKARIGVLSAAAARDDINAFATTNALFEKRKSEQMQLAVSMFAPKAVDNDPFTTQVLASILGGGMASRLFTDLREKRGLVYGVDCYPERFNDVGRLNIAAGTNENHAEEVIKRILGHIEDLAINGPNENELARAKKSIETSIMLSFESSSARLSAAVNQACVLNHIMDMNEITEAINGVSARDIQSLANAALDRKYRAAAAIGKSGKSAIEKFLVS